MQRLRGAGDKRQSAFVHEPFDSVALSNAIETTIRDEGLDEVCVLDGSDGSAGLADRLSRSFGSRAATPEGLAADIDYAVLLARALEGSEGLRSELHRFARTAAGRPGQTAPIVVMLSRVVDAECATPTWTCWSTHGVLGPLDGASFAAHASDRRDSFAARLAIAVAVEVGAWDLGIVERLQSMPIACAVRPDLNVARWSDGRFEAWRGLEKADWSAGSHDSWGGETYIHPLFLAANRPTLLAKRVWRGQVAVLFPWLEERRQEVVQAHRAVLRPDLSSFQDDVATLDWGPICRQLSRQPASVLDYVQCARRLRNTLAHGRPVAWTDIDECMRMAAGRTPARSRSS